ncbi:3,4-dihydroxy 2-butanone 4-phosphate synthase [Succinivibrio dextrinosolvens]|uniref:3,4-dihydroxy-2-butanone-4-phosphate synthase n=1 Tax=Succinivibrio dextrinosolvens TaxID=83771 RepID=UPI0008F29859|nr:3,4-dihydroxy-2-butanone-4-phosphate synthase [Succinivibrio dextrinosolvens]SFS43581.1 3,4-dihydroxy 2-butanone 4-phosphate synthase [Succinivibrio dextrinosolvens]
MSFKNLLENFGETPIDRVEAAITALKRGRGILVVDNEDRENEGDLIYAAETVTDAQMAFMIRECSGIVCVCIEEEQAKRMNLPMMVKNNTSVYGTAFTISVDAAKGVTTGVSAPDRVKAIKAVINPEGKPEDLASPGHMFPLVAKKGGVLERDGHTEASVDLARLAGLAPAGILCELCAPDGLMAKLPRVTQFALEHDLTCLSIEDLIAYRKAKNV